MWIVLKYSYHRSNGRLLLLQIIKHFICESPNWNWWQQLKIVDDCFWHKCQRKRVCELRDETSRVEQVERNTLKPQMTLLQKRPARLFSLYQVQKTTFCGRGMASIYYDSSRKEQVENLCSIESLNRHFKNNKQGLDY